MNRAKKTALAAAVALCASGNAAAISITNTDGTFQDWTGFDLSSGSTALIDGFAGDGSTFTLTFWGTISGLYTLNNAYLNTPGLDPGLGVGGDYEYTFYGTLNETASCNAAGTQCSFQINSGSLNMWYDTAPDANYITGAGITDGELMLTGTAGPQAGGLFSAISPEDGFGVSTLISDITFTNLALIDPALATATTVATLQIGIFTTGGWIPPTSQPGAGGATSALTGNVSTTDTEDGVTYFALQVDGNVGIAAVPEPGSVALMGIGLAALGLGRRRWFRGA